MPERTIWTLAGALKLKTQRRLYEDVAPLMCYRCQSGLSYRLCYLHFSSQCLNVNATGVFFVSGCCQMSLSSISQQSIVDPLFLYIQPTRMLWKHLVHSLNRSSRAVVVDSCYSIGYLYAFVCFLDVSCSFSSASACSSQAPLKCLCKRCFMSYLFSLIMIKWHRSLINLSIKSRLGSRRHSRIMCAHGESYWIKDSPVYKSPFWAYFTIN